MTSEDSGKSFSKYSILGFNAFFACFALTTEPFQKKKHLKGKIEILFIPFTGVENLTFLRNL